MSWPHFSMPPGNARTTHYSPSAWASVTHRVKEAVVKRPLVGADKK
jgi:hypothetical protein